jgi:hypothetical protein
MSADRSNHTFSPGPTPNTVRAADGTIHTIPDGCVLLSPGDAALTRRVKAAGHHWVVQEKKGRKTFSRGVWAPAATIERIRVGEVVQPAGVVMVVVGPMLPQASSPSQPPRRFGVGIDTSRYGHVAAFLRDDLQPAADDLQFAESAAGYTQLRQRLEHIERRHGGSRFVVRLDAAGQYADNLIAFLHALGTATPNTTATPAFALSLSCGDPQRNKNYRAAVFGNKKSDPVEARAAARFALTEKPPPDIPMSLELRTLRQVAGRLQAVVRQRTRLINQLHHLLALAFPELALLVKDIAAGWVLELTHRYPSAQRLAEASAADLAGIPYLPEARVEPLLEQARSSVASLIGPAVEELLRDQVR